MLYSTGATVCSQPNSENTSSAIPNCRMAARNRLQASSAWARFAATAAREHLHVGLHSPRHDPRCRHAPAPRRGYGEACKLGCLTGLLAQGRRGTLDDSLDVSGRLRGHE